MAAATVVAVVVSTVEGSAVAGFMVGASALALSTAVVVSVGDASAVVISTAVAFAVAGLVDATGMATGAITDSLMISSSAATGIRGGGAGAIRTDITRTITMATATTHTATTHTVTMDPPDMVTMVGPVTDTATAVDQGI